MQHHFKIKDPLGALPPRARWKATQGVPGPRASRKFACVASDPRAKRRVAQGWLVHLFDRPRAFEGYLEQASSWSPLTLSGHHGPLEGSGLESHLIGPLGSPSLLETWKNILMPFRVGRGPGPPVHGRGPRGVAQV
jgi:hypothetical protein